MIRGIYFSARGMIAEKQRLDMSSNNLANAQTSGFKREFPLFSSSGQVDIWRVNDTPGVTLLSRGAGPLPAPVGFMTTGSRLEGSLTDHSQGGLVETGNPLDLALEGPGYFAVETPGGVRYTRSGAFVMDGAGYLVTSQGFRVLGESGPLRMQQGEVSVDKEGNVRSGNTQIGRFHTVDFQDPLGLERQGDSLFAATERSGPATLARDARVRQGYLEGANVNALKEMVEIITIMRAYESNQKALQAQDEALGKAIDQVARLY
ncbi:MAG: flagellar basal-body rod protein FlgF [Bacillota bacterium]